MRKGSLVFILLALTLVFSTMGCKKSSDDLDGKNLPPGTGKAMNPSGTITDPHQQAVQAGMQASGDSASKNAAAAAAGFKGH